MQILQWGSPQTARGSGSCQPCDAVGGHGEFRERFIDHGGRTSVGLKCMEA